MKPPVWVCGRVPNGYWHARANRVKYMNWLGKRLRFRKRTDWYRLSRQHFHANFGGGLLAAMFGDSPLRALRDFAPRFDWKPWLLNKTPQQFWQSRANRCTYMKWLGEQLGYRESADWYQITKQDFSDHRGDGLLSNYYRNSPIDAVKDYLPRTRWKEWLFAEVPQRFWNSRENRQRYIRWLGRDLGYRRRTDWYNVTRRDFYTNHGGTLLHTPHHYSPIELLRETYPDDDWHEWRFYRVPSGFWKKQNNRRAYFNWLARQLGYTCIADWYSITQRDIRAHCGAALLNDRYSGSLMRFLKDVAPKHRWNKQRLLYGVPNNRKRTRHSKQTDSRAA